MARFRPAFSLVVSPVRFRGTLVSIEAIWTARRTAARIITARGIGPGASIVSLPSSGWTLLSVRTLLGETRSLAVLSLLAAGFFVAAWPSIIEAAILLALKWGLLIAAAMGGGGRFIRSVLSPVRAVRLALLPGLRIAGGVCVTRIAAWAARTIIVVLLARAIFPRTIYRLAVEPGASRPGSLLAFVPAGGAASIRSLVISPWLFKVSGHVSFPND